MARRTNKIKAWVRSSMITQGSRGNRHSMAALLSGTTDPSVPICLLHASFADFLMDRTSKPIRRETHLPSSPVLSSYLLGFQVQTMPLQIAPGNRDGQREGGLSQRGGGRGGVGSESRSISCDCIPISINQRCKVNVPTVQGVKTIIRHYDGAIYLFRGIRPLINTRTYACYSWCVVPCITILSFKLYSQNL